MWSVSATIRKALAKYGTRTATRRSRPRCVSTRAHEAVGVATERVHDHMLRTETSQRQFLIGGAVILAHNALEALVEKVRGS